MKQETNFLQNSYRLLKMIRSLDYGIIPLYMLTSLVQSIYPFITILFSARIIDVLFKGEFEKALVLAGIMILVNALGGVLLHYLLYKREVASMVINRKCNSFVALKAISLDYATFENKKTLDEFEFADGNISSNGGFGSYLLNFSNLLNGIFSLIISLVFLFKLIIMPITIENVSFWLTPVGSMLILLTILIILAIFYLKIFEYVGKESLECYYKNIEAERHLNYFNYYLFMNEIFAKEIRMYRMQPLLYQEWKKIRF